MTYGPAATAQAEQAADMYRVWEQNRHNLNFQAKNTDFLVICHFTVNMISKLLGFVE